MKYHLGVIQSELAFAIGVRLKAFYTDPVVAARVFTEGVEALRKRYDFGGRVQYPSPHTPGLSYVHLTTLGASMIFPADDGEPNVRPACFPDIRSAAEAVRTVTDFAGTYWVRFYVDYARKLGELTGRPVKLGLSSEGPITSAALLYGDGFWVAMMEDPEATKEFLAALSDSAAAFTRLTRRLAGEAAQPDSAGIADDLASLIGPRQWDEFVLPFWQRIYDQAKVRQLHCENLTEGHLPLLNRLGLALFDPSRSPKLSPALLRRRLTCPWQWRVQVAHCLEGPDELKRQIQEAYEYGADRLALYIDRGVEPRHVEVFIETAERLGIVSGATQ